MVEYYTGRDASLMTEDQIALKVSQINRIRKLENDKELLNTFNNLINAK